MSDVELRSGIFSTEMDSDFDDDDASGARLGDHDNDGLQRLARHLQQRDEHQHQIYSRGDRSQNYSSFSESEDEVYRGERSLRQNTDSNGGRFQSFYNTGPGGLLTTSGGTTADVTVSELETAVYEKFDTIDWPREEARDRATRERLRRRAIGQRPKWKRKIMRLFHSSQAWILLLLVGVGTALTAAFIDMGVEWLGDTRNGFCRDAWWVNSGLCCREFVGEGSGSDAECDRWIPWSKAVGVSELDPVGSFWTSYAAYVILAVLYAGVAGLLVKTYSKWAAGSGIPETKTILGGFVIGGFSAPKTLLTKAVGLVFSVSSGLNLGKEGPLVHVGMCVADLASRIFPKYGNNEGKKRELLSAACAAGVSVAFGAPIGGVLFSLEEASYYFPHKTLWRSFFAAIVAAVTLMYMNPLKTGKLVLFETRYLHGFETFELVPFALIAVIGGIVGVIFINLNLKMCRLRKTSRLRHWPVAEACAVAAATAIVHYLNPYLRGGASKIIANLVNECNPQEKHSPLCSLDPGQAGETAGLLVLAAVARLLLTVFTFGLRVPAGLFIPSLAIGASLGRAVGIGLQQLVLSFPDAAIFAECSQATECVTPGVYAMLGAAAALGGVTRMTVSLVVIIFELTGELKVMVPIMFAILIAKWVGDAFGIDGIYDEHILLNEYPFLDNKAEYRFKVPVSEVMTSGKMCVIDVHTHTLDDDRRAPTGARDGSATSLVTHEVIQGPHTVESLERLIQTRPYTGFPLVREGDILVGFIATRELKVALASARTRPTDSSRDDFRRTQRSVKGTTLCCFTGTEITAAQRAKKASEVHLGSNTPRTVVVDLRQFVQRSPVTVTSETSMNVVFSLFKKLGVRHLLIANRGHVVGMVTKKDVLQHIAMQIHNAPRKFIRRAGGVMKTTFRVAPSAREPADGGGMSPVGSQDDLHAFGGNHDDDDDDDDGLGGSARRQSSDLDAPALIDL